MANDTPSVKTYASLLRTAAADGDNLASAVSKVILKSALIQACEKIARLEKGAEEDERAYQRCHADLLSLISIVTDYPLNSLLRLEDWQQVKAIAARWTEGG